MIKTQCLSCKKILWRSPSKVEPRNYCSREFYAKVRNKEIMDRGKPFRITHKSRQEIYKGYSVPKGLKHYAWKGEDVSYHGLHMWLRREKGNPTQCSFCGKVSRNKRVIQWANIDGKYHRILEDYIALCGSCHKLKDL